MKTYPGFLVASLLLLAGPHALSETVHGPICSWHLDPTTTMTIQWIERVDAAVEEDVWLTAKAGFGYGDGDDATTLAMQNKSRTLYIRKEFELRGSPSDRPALLFGNWTAKAMHEGNSVEHALAITFGQNRRTRASVTQGDGEAEDMASFETEGNAVQFKYALEIGGQTKSVIIDAEETEPGKLSGKWREVDEDGSAVTTGSDWTAEREAGRFGGRGGRGGRGRGDRDAEPNLKLILKARYDDGFIAYLNGVEIVRANVASGSGSTAEGIQGHDADEEETFEIDSEELVKLLRRGRNVLAIEGHNNAMDSSDFTLDPQFSYEAFGRTRSVIARGEDWDFYLGESPQSDWATSEIAATPFGGIPDNASTYILHHGARGGDLETAVQAERRLFADTGQVIHQALLTGLQPDTPYAFELERSGRSERGRRYFFKTAPRRAEREVRFVTGGDMYHDRSDLDAMNAQAARHEPLFALLGGDLAYANGRDANRWYDWVDSWAQHAITPEDFCLPFIAVIGNHEVNGNLNEVTNREERARFDPRKRAKFYYSLFPLPEETSNFVVDFSDYMSIVCLDSDHTQTPESQTSWLEETLQKRASLPNLFVCYHRPAFGTLVKEDITSIRRHWTPLFERYGVDAAFENDHHVYKRTLPLRDGVMHPDGVMYIGDGAWGVDVRDIPWEKARNLSYIVRGESVKHFIRVSLFEGYQRFDAFDVTGKPIDNHLRVRR